MTSSVLLILGSILATSVIQHASAASICWDCDKIGARGAEDEESSTEKPLDIVPPFDNNVSSNALDSLFRDPPQDTLTPPKKDNVSKNNQDNVANGSVNANNQQGSFPNAGVTDIATQPTPGRWSGIDTLVALFFAVAAIWLITATVYSITLLVLIRLQARGELDIYDENLGRWTFCNGRFSLHFGCIVRRYAIQLERDYQRRLQQRYGDADGETPQEPVPIRIMTREERRHAVERLLGIQPNKLEHVGSDKNSQQPKKTDEKNHIDCELGPPSPAHSLGSSQEGPVCSICLDCYSASDVVFKSTKCAHIFHKDCLMEWLERRNNTVRICSSADTAFLG